MSALDALPRLPLAGGATPLQPLPRLTAELGGPNLWAKRDDLTTLAGGGNKARKLEYLLARAVADGCDTVVTFGAVQSNHCRMTAAAARICGLEPILVLSGAEPATSNGNLLLDRLLGARLVFVSDYGAERDATVAGLTRELAEAGRAVAWIPGGGSTPLGAMGYARGALELQAQCDAAGFTPASLYYACGTEGTHRGLVYGATLAGWPVPLRGVAVARPETRAAFGTPEPAAFYAAMNALLGLSLPVADVPLLETHVGEGYGAPTAAGREAIRLAARREGLVLDPVYTAKAFGALLADVRAGRFCADDHVVFLHTGGLPGLFPLGDALLA